jgi:hypothetical protein
MLLCRINLFYDVAYCISLECCDFEEDALEIITRLQTLASNLTPSHEVPTSVTCTRVYTLAY